MSDAKARINQLGHELLQQVFRIQGDAFTDEAVATVLQDATDTLARIADRRTCVDAVRAVHDLRR